MATVKRLYLYGVLGVALVPLLLGLSVLVQLVLETLAGLVGANAIVGSRLAREELSRALALVVVGAPIWALHAWLLRRSMRASPVAEADERASDARSTYVFVVLSVTLAVAGWNLFEATSTFARWLLAGGDPGGLAGSLAGLAVVGGAWLLHLRLRAEDLRAVPSRLAGDWLTRLYVYGALFIILAIGLAATANVLTTLVRALLGLTPTWESSTWWREALAGPLAGVLITALGWSIHWRISGRLLAAAPPVGEAHRRSRARSGYFVAVVMLCATVVLVMGTQGLRHVLAEVLGVWRASDGSRLLEDAGGPFVMLLPFLGAWWWHIRRAAVEAFAFGGPTRGRSVVRSGRYVVALVGLTGLSVGMAWGMQALLALLDLGQRQQVISAALLRTDGTPAVALAILGCCLWLPSWMLAQRERAHEPLEVASATSRRAYLLLVSGVAVTALMISLASLVYQAARYLLEAGHLGDTAWAIGTLLVASVVLTYHLIALRSDLRLAAASTLVPAVPSEVETIQPSAIAPRLEVPAGRAIETLELWGPAEADLETLNAALRSRLPEGFTLRVVGEGPKSA